MAALFPRFVRRTLQGTPPRPTVRPVLESLEDRLLLSGLRLYLGIPAPVSAGVPFQFTVEANDFDTGRTLTDYGGTVSFAGPDPQWIPEWDAGASLPGAYTFQPGDHGRHTFTATYGKPGSWWMTVSDPSAGVAHTTPFRVDPPAPAALTLTSPDVAVPGRPFQVTVTAQGADGKPAAGYAGTVHFTSSDPRAVLPPDYTFPPGGGSPSFTVTLRTEGRQTLTVTDATAQLTASRGLDVRNNQATRFRLSTDSPDVKGGVSFDLSVWAINDSGAVDPNYAGTVHFTSSDPRAELPADVTFSPADGGQKRVSVKLHTWGLQTITATEVGGSLTGVSGPLRVKRKQADAFRIYAPAKVKAGVPFEVGVEALGNFAKDRDTDYRGTVHLSSNPALSLADYTFTDADRGFHTFTVTLRAAGEDNLHVREDDGPITADTAILVERTHFVFNTPKKVTYGKPFSFTLTAVNEHTEPDPTFTGAVHFNSSDAHAKLPADYTFTPADRGVHTFTAMLRPRPQGNEFYTEPQTLFAVNAPEAIYEESNPIQVNNDYHLAILNAPLTTEPGKPFPFTVAVLDDAGQPVPGFDKSVRLVSTDPKATLPSSYTFTDADGGQHTFTANLQTAGVQKITAHTLELAGGFVWAEKEVTVRGSSPQAPHSAAHDSLPPAPAVPVGVVLVTQRRGLKKKTVARVTFSDGSSREMLAPFQQQFTGLAAALAGLDRVRFTASNGTKKVVRIVSL